MICCVVDSTWLLCVILIPSFNKCTVTFESASKLCCLPSISYINNSSKPEGIHVSRIALGLLGSVLRALRWNSLMLVKRIQLSAWPAVCLNLRLLWMSDLYTASSLPLCFLLAEVGWLKHFWFLVQPTSLLFCPCFMAFSTVTAKYIGFSIESDVWNLTCCQFLFSSPLRYAANSLSSISSFHIFCPGLPSR